MKRQVEVIKPGLLTTVQDAGRYGYQQYGIVVSGAMDPFSLQVGNILVGNKRNEAGLEVTLFGPELLFHDNICIAISGADLGAVVESKQSMQGKGNAREAPLWTSFVIRKGDILRFTAPVRGARAYVTFAGGIDVPIVLGSKSTYVKAAIGGFQGRPLKKGDLLDIGLSSEGRKKVSGKIVIPEARPQFEHHAAVKVILGPQDDYFTPKGLATFLSSVYSVTDQSDRMGFRLEGPVIEHRDRADIISDAIAVGSIQVPPDGKPVLLLADRQTTGGYAKIGTVISTDILKVGQLKPGDTLSFQAVTVDEARHLYIEREQLLRLLSL